MAEEFSIVEYIAAQFIGFGIFALGVVIVAVISNLFKKNETR